MKIKVINFVPCCLLIFVCCSSVFAQVSFDTIVYRKNGTIQNRLDMTATKIELLSINSEKGADIYDLEKKEFYHFKVGYKPLIISGQQVEKKIWDEYFMCTMSGKYGIADADGNEIIPIIFDEIKDGRVYDYFVAFKSDSTYLIGLDGSMVFLGTGFKKYYTEVIAENRVLAKSKEGNLIFNYKGKLLFKSDKYDLMPAGNSKYLFAKKIDDYDAFYFLIDFKGRTVIKPANSYDQCYFDDQLIIFYSYNNSEVYDYDLNAIVQDEYMIMKPVMKDFYEIKKDKNVGIIKKDFEVLFPPEYKNIFPIKSQGMFKVRNSKGEAYYDTEKNLLSPFGFTKCYMIEGSDYFRVYKNYKWGVVDLEGNEIIPVKIDRVRDFLSPIGAYVNTNGIHFFIRHSMDRVDLVNEQGELITGVYYPGQKNVYPMTDGKSISVYIDEKRGLMSFAGKEVIPPVYSFLYFKLNGGPSKYVVVTEKNKYGLFDYEGRQVLPTEYKYIANIDDSLFLIQDSEGAGFLRLKQK